MKVFFTSFGTLQDVNGWPKKVIAQYYQMILNMAPLPWQRLTSASFGTAQFQHKQRPAEPAGHPSSQQLQGDEHSQSPEQSLEAADAEKAQLFFAKGYCKSILATIDPENSMADAMSQLKGVDIEGSDLSDLERLESSSLRGLCSLTKPMQLRMGLWLCSYKMLRRCLRSKLS